MVPVVPALAISSALSDTWTAWPYQSFGFGVLPLPQNSALQSGERPASNLDRVAPPPLAPPAMMLPPLSMEADRQKLPVPASAALAMTFPSGETLKSLPLSLIEPAR